jgi:hypothetical protein
MEPQLPTPHSSPEQGPLYRSEQAPRVPEVDPSQGAPEREATQESKAGGQGSEPTAIISNTPVFPSVAPPVPAMPAPVADDSDDNPLLAADDDLIE